ncbi:MAG: hypothetical protein OSB05_08190, partial [Akkermansiaceae bacterium]|nr:hypothetical protein [Akkermansiaceae bacterium]
MPAQDLGPTIELFRHRFLHALRDAKLISPQKLANLLAWKHSGFNIHHGGEQPIPAPGRKRNFEIFIAAALLHLPPKSQKTVRYYGPLLQQIPRPNLPHPGPHHPASQTRDSPRKTTARPDPPHPRAAQKHGFPPSAAARDPSQNKAYQANS